MRLKNIVVVFLSILMLSYGYDVEAQRRKYKRRSSGRQGVKSRGSSGQSRVSGPYSYFGANINSGNYIGDLSPKNSAVSIDFGATGFGFGGFYGLKFHRQIAIRMSLNWVRISANDFVTGRNNIDSNLRYARNLSFRNDLIEFQSGAQFYLLKDRPPFNAYLFLGVGLTFHNPKGKVPERDWQADPSGNTIAPSAGQWVNLRELGTEGQNIGLTKQYSTAQFVIPIAIGVDVRIPGTNFDAGIEAGIRYTFTDYLDDVSDKYVDLNLLDPNGSNPLVRIMSDRSTERQNVDGDARDLSTYNITKKTSGFYTIDGYGTSGEIRGGVETNDIYLVTQLKIIYNLNNSNSGRRPGGRR